MTTSSTIEATEEFLVWLDAELDERGWSDYKLSKRADIAHSVISKARNEKRPIGFAACVKIADALELPAALVLEKAGLIKPSPLDSRDPELDELAFLFERIPPERRKHFLNVARTFLDKNEL